MLIRDFRIVDDIAAIVTDSRRRRRDYFASARSREMRTIASSSSPSLFLPRPPLPPARRILNDSLIHNLERG